MAAGFTSKLSWTWQNLSGWHTTDDDSFSVKRMDVERVVLDGLTPSEYHYLVASTLNPRRIQQRSVGFREISELLSLKKPPSNLPKWIPVFRDLVQSLQNSRTSYRSRLEVAKNLAYPVMNHAWQRVSEMAVLNGGIVLTQAARRSLRRSLLNQLGFVARNPAEWMWSVLSANSKILIESHRKNSEKVLHDVIFTNGVEPLVLRLLEYYPALARLWSIQVGNWISHMGEFLGHAKAFARGHLGLLSEPTIRKIEPDLSDPHSGNRSVMKVWFGNGSRWFYKPRSGRCEKAWFALLDWLNKERFPTLFSSIKVVCKRDHCWMQAVQHRPCNRKKEATHYYFRAGALLYLIHWLRGVDFHAGNIIAQGSQPIVVDCETLFHPKIKVPQTAKREAGSILRTGMLPVWNPKTKLSDSVSALGRVAFGSHSVRLKGNAVSATEFLDSIEDGFRTMHRFLTGRRRFNGLTRILRRFQQLQYRRVYEPTVSYYRRLEKSVTVSSLVSGRARHQVLCRLCGIQRQASRRARDEVQCLENADIPIFYGKPVSPQSYSMRKVNQDVEIVRSALTSTQPGKVVF